MFPSPIGVLYISMTMISPTLPKFPSPIGVLYISIFASSDFSVTSLAVSVPYWGSLYFNKLYGLPEELFLQVSVPYWGSLYFNKTMRKPMVTRTISFRPLLGFFIFQLSLLDKYTFQKVSVPYWGSLYFNPVLRSPYNYRAAKPDCGAKPNPAFTI